VQSKEKKRRTEDVNASCEEAMEGMMHALAKSQDKRLNETSKRRRPFFLSLFFSFWLAIKRKREREREREGE
jgi:hypothetical protein